MCDNSKYAEALRRLNNYIINDKAASVSKIKGFIENFNNIEYVEALENISHMNNLNDMRIGIRSLLYGKDEYKITISGLGKIEHAEFELKDISIITGRNNLGKSTILKGTFALFKIYKEYFEIANLDVDAPISLTKGEQAYINARVVNKIKGGFQVERKEILTLKAAFRCRAILKGIFNLSEKSEYSLNLYRYNKLIVTVTNKDIIVDTNQRNYMIPEVTYISSPHILNYLTSIDTNRVSSTEVGVNAPGIIPYYDEDLLSKLIPKINSELSNEEVVNFILDDNMSNLPIIYDGIFKIKDGEEYYLPSEVGNGLKLEAMINNLEKNKVLDSHSILIIDEPEDSIHTYMLKNIVNMLAKVSGNILIATHSSDLLYLISKYSPDLYLLKENNNLGLNYSGLSSSNLEESLEHITREIIGEIVLDDFN